MVVPILSCTGENGTIDTFQQRQHAGKTHAVKKCNVCRANAIPIFLLFFNGNYVQTQWQWAWTRTLNANNCWFFLFHWLFVALCSVRFAFSLSSRAARSRIWARVLMISMRWHRCGRVVRCCRRLTQFLSNEMWRKKSQWFLQQRWQHDIKLVQLISLAIITHLSGSRKRSTDGRGHTHPHTIASTKNGSTYIQCVGIFYYKKFSIFFYFQLRSFLKSFRFSHSMIVYSQSLEVLWLALYHRFMGLAD